MVGVVGRCASAMSSAVRPTVPQYVADCHVHFTCGFLDCVSGFIDGVSGLIDHVSGFIDRVSGFMDHVSGCLDYMKVFIYITCDRL
jgi:hypothetical protein